MKRILTLLLILSTIVATAHAEQVSADRAMDIARNVLGQTTRSISLYVAWDSSLFAQTRVERIEPTFYVVTPTSGEGFVIVAGDDAIAPVLAYSTSYAAPIAKVLPPNFEGWLRYVDSVVRYAREHNIVADKATAQLWSEGYTPVDAIMLNTARWSQLEPYNIYCPIDNGQHSLTGCTQTAMAVIMYHNRWPERAKGVTEAYTTAYGLDVAKRDLNHSYDWDNMLETYVEGEYNDAQAEAVAVLMADLGHAFKADYTSAETGAFPDMLALYEKFSYSPASSIMMRKNYSDSFWTTLLRNEIEANRPIFYSGYTVEDAGHAFVLDGVDANDYFHVNWGWGGVYDGFFLINNLLLDVYLFDTSHWAVLGMHPMRDGKVDNWLCLVGSGLKLSTTEFERGVPFNVESITLGNYSQLDFKGKVRVGVCDMYGEFKSWATEAQNLELPSIYGGGCGAMTAVIESDIIAGDRLVVYYCADGTDKWYRIMPMAEDACAEVVLKYAPIGDTTSMSFDKQSGLLVVDYDDDVKSALYLLKEYVESGVTITRGRMVVDTKLLNSDAEYTILLRREGVEDKNIRFKINKAQ